MLNGLTYQRPNARCGPANIKIPNERSEMNFVLNRLKLLDCRSQQKAGVCDRVDSIAPSRISVGKEVGRMPPMTQLLDSFVGNKSHAKTSSTAIRSPLHRRG